MPSDTLRVDARCVAQMAPFWRERRRHKIARGGRGSGKSWSIARMLVARATAEPIRWLCCRETQKSIAESSKQLLADQIDTMGLPALFDVQKTQIVGANGSHFVFAGLREHTVQSIKSYEGFDGAWIEEASAVSRESANILLPTIRRPGSELWWSYNPTLPDDFVHVLADSGRADVLVVTINWRDNEWFPPELDGERRELERINDALYRHVWEGECRSQAGLLFKRAWFRCYDAAPANLSIYMASDYAVTPPDEANPAPDWTEHGVFGLDETGALYILDWWSGQTSPEEWIDAAAHLIERWRPKIWFDEKGAIRRALDGAITKRLRERNVWIYREGITSASSKAERALGFAARASAGAVYLPRVQWADRLVNQLCAFTGEDGHTDDMVDVCSLIARGLDKMINARRPAKAEAPPPPFSERWFAARDRDQAMSEAQRARYYR